MTSTPVIEVERLDVRYGDFHAVKDLSVVGHATDDRAAVRPRTGIMLQKSGFSPDLTVEESVALIGRLTQRTGRVVALVGLTGEARTEVSPFSGGEKRRLDFATAVYGPPELIFLDELTTGPDVQPRDDLWAAVNRLRDNGATTLPISLTVIAVTSRVSIPGTEELPLIKRLLPGRSATGLVLNAWNGGVALGGSLAPTLVRVVAAMILASRLFRWQPRR